MGTVRMKRHARLRGDDRLLWVGDEADWALMRSTPRPNLRCPEPGCGDALHAVRNGRGTRFLRRTRNGAGGADCPHWWVATNGGGPESPRHLWLKARLASMCLQQGWAAVPEDPVTRADVWVPDARAALEVQLRRSDTLGRTHARMEAGADTVAWFIAADVAAAGTLFRAPAVRFAVVSAADSARAVQPWDEPGTPARVLVYATVWRWREWRLASGRMSAYTFLAEVLSGRMIWCPPGTPGLPHGRSGWVGSADYARSLRIPEPPPGQLAAILPVAPKAWVRSAMTRRPSSREDR